jgi:zinc protease
VSPADRSRLPAAGPEPAFRFPVVEKSRLPNGLAVWTVERPALPLVSFVLMVPAGAAADPPSKPGLAALTADMLDEGSGDRSAIDIQDALARIGADLNTEVGPDAAILALNTLDRFLEPSLGLLADIVVRPRLAQDDLDRVRELRLNRLLQLRDIPAALAERVFLARVFGDHPYGHLPIGSSGTLREVSRDEVAGFHERAYVPARATLVGVGAVSHQSIVEAAANAFGGWSGRASDDRLEDRLGAAIGGPAWTTRSRLVVVDRPGAAQSELRIGHAAAARHSPDYHALLVLNTILGGQFVSRINLNLREDKGYTYGAHTMFEFRKGRGPFVLQTSVRTDATSDAIREALREMGAIRDERPPTGDEMELARAALTRGYPRSFETAGQVARSLAQLVLYDLPDTTFEVFVPSVRAIDAAAVSDVARRHVDPERLAVVVVGDRERISAGLASLGLGEPVEAGVEF